MLVRGTVVVLRGAMESRLDAVALAAEINRRIQGLPRQTTEPVRRVRRDYSRLLRDASGGEVLAVAEALLEHARWVAYELVHYHPGALSSLDSDLVVRLGRGLDSWEFVDAFGRYVSGPAWQRGLVPDELIQGWSAASDRWWRRAALVSTVPLNLRSAGGTGDVSRTLDICRRLVTDRDDMVVKALSWALRQLTVWDRKAVQALLEEHDHVLASRVRREVTNKLETGLKSRSRTRPTT